MLIDKTFFTSDIFIPNLNEQCDNLYFFEWIELWEEQCLRTVLGDCLYNDFVNQLSWDEDAQKYLLKVGVDDKWDWLLNGHSYTKDDINQSSNVFYSGCGCGCFESNCENLYWEGLIKITQRRIPNITINKELVNAIEIKRSLIAYYIYWMWGLKTDTMTTSTGEQIANVKNMERVSNEHLRIDAHNKFVSMVIDCDSSGNVGLYKFIQDFSNLYPEWGGKCLDYEPIW